MKYLVNLTNPEDLKNSEKTCSFGSGKYGFCVHAENMAEAKQKVIERAKNDNFFGTDWKADITRLKNNGQKDEGISFFEIFDPERNSTIKLFK